MAIEVFNPGEPVFDQETGEPYIDDDGALVEVAAGLLVATSDGRTLQGDDVANAAWYRANLYEGECIRDAAIGVPYQREALGQSDVDLAASTIIAEVKTRTPGVSGVVNIRITNFNPTTRILRFTSTILRGGGGEVNADTVVG